MANKVGPKGQVVINKEIRQQLGVEPGWLALQLLVDDHVEVYFLPPPHNRSLMGRLAKYVKKPIAPDEDWAAIREAAWENAVREDFTREELDR